ncbi:hypothetical protein ACFVXC_05550 [Streptomyces sp. NPDC058257]|uniref:hypothetical protein n=1 Tax=Streptomyces sp. NPDC058257 TaxID=3346409 RepID=UPI0036EF1572
MHVEIGDTPQHVEDRWNGYSVVHGPLVVHCTRAVSEPVMFAREDRVDATIMRPNLLHPGWWRGGWADTASPVLPAKIEKEEVFA